MDRGAWGATVPGVAKTTEQLTTHTHRKANHEKYLEMFLARFLQPKMWNAFKCVKCFLQILCIEIILQVCSPGVQNVP